MVFLPLLMLLAGASAHSWIECSNYLMTSVEDRNYWDASKCLGYPRCSAARSGIFGSEGTLNYQSLTGNACPCARGAKDDYTDAYPKATYVPGQRVCLAYPAKNHVADVCTNKDIPDNGMIVYRTMLGATEDPPLSQWPVPYLNNTNGVHVNGVIDYKGFQNCPKFCEDMPNAFCSMCFDLEPDLAVGSYSFHWEWTFNVGQAKYISCWEADVVASSDQPTPAILPPTTVASTTVPTPMPAPPGVVPSVQPVPATPRPSADNPYFDCE
ncbi:hypothetical protein ACHHYP_07806 [Achlya hypogyna]|uniref:Secreted protein n=1 Tax=Achlya hypogyna TaxID=1202772 RepID=A0A0A7CML8_ACHHY|nr:secreted protein [Achlya hypogyna]OQR87946.1 hypothetical protein ACHHYP_07806 [Achlya hypogyna]